MHQIKHKFLEERWWRLGYLFEQFLGDCGANLLHCAVDSFVRGLLRHRFTGVGCITCDDSLPLGFSTAFADHPAAGLLVESVWVPPEQVSPAVRDPPDSGRGRLNVPCGLKHTERPTASMAVSKVREICESLCPLRLCKTHQVWYGFVDAAPLIAVWMLSQIAQDRVMERCLGGKCGGCRHGFSFPVGQVIQLQLASAASCRLESTHSMAQRGSRSLRKVSTASHPRRRWTRAQLSCTM